MSRRRFRRTHLPSAFLTRTGRRSCSDGRPPSPRAGERFTSVVYKGGGWLDLRAAELTAPVTTVVAVAYKSRIDILVPPGVRVEMEGLGVSNGWFADDERERQLPQDAPVVHIRGIAYKGTIEASTRPPGAGGRRAAIGR